MAALAVMKATPLREQTNTPEARRARHDADVMRAAEVALAKATASGDPSQVKTAIEAMAKAREFCGDSGGHALLPVTVEVTLDTRVAVDPDDDVNEPHASH